MVRHGTAHRKQEFTMIEPGVIEIVASVVFVALALPSWVTDNKLLAWCCVYVAGMFGQAAAQKSGLVTWALAFIDSLIATGRGFLQ